MFLSLLTFVLKLFEGRCLLWMEPYLCSAPVTIPTWLSQTRDQQWTFIPTTTTNNNNNSRSTTTLKRGIHLSLGTELQNNSKEALIAEVCLCWLYILQIIHYFLKTNILCKVQLSWDRLRQDSWGHLFLICTKLKKKFSTFLARNIIKFQNSLTFLKEVHFVYILDAESYCILQRVQSASALCQLHLDISHGQAWGQDEMSFFQGMHEQSWTGAYKLLWVTTQHQPSTDTSSLGMPGLLHSVFSSVWIGMKCILMKY